MTIFVTTEEFTPDGRLLQPIVGVIKQDKAWLRFDRTALSPQLQPSKSDIWEMAEKLLDYTQAVKGVFAEVGCSHPFRY